MLTLQAPKHSLDLQCDSNEAHAERSHKVAGPLSNVNYTSVAYSSNDRMTGELPKLQVRKG